MKGVATVLLAVVAIATVALGAFAIVDRMMAGEHAAERRALLARQTELTGRALAPGSPLACLAGGAGETVGNACEKAVFADAASASAALSFTAARLLLLQEAARLGDAAVTTALTGDRRAIELDRFGLAAQVLADRDGCTPERCAAFALVGETGAIKANMKARVYEQYVSRYAAEWGRAPAAAAAPSPGPQASLPPVIPVTPDPAAMAAEGAQPPAATGHPVDPKWDFPSSDSIPAVSIMNSEPPRPKLKEGAAAHTAAEGGAPPVPPKRPQAQAPTATQPR
ncbi:hypothetical protein [Pseudolabrys taiwanensis]|uniref:hypothetical protein n=1 Tax=Pseudolabrys taiwanensis TaxID=331696 RepID=UPI0013B45071|nr:hypothetical protein [Pseudolabrys taiwanensis]